MQNSLEKEMIRRAALTFLPLAGLAVYFLEQQWLALLGLLLGALLSVIRFLSHSWVFHRVCRQVGGSVWMSISVFLLNQLILFLLLFGAFSLNIWLFWCLVAGTLLMPLVLLLNAATEALGLTKNGFFM